VSRCSALLPADILNVYDPDLFNVLDTKWSGLHLNLYLDAWLHLRVIEIFAATRTGFIRSWAMSSQG
jgi:hypothetical protein